MDKGVTGVISTTPISDNPMIFSHSVNRACVFIDSKEFSDSLLIAVCACVSVCVAVCFMYSSKSLH